MVKQGDRIFITGIKDRLWNEKDKEAFVNDFYTVLKVVETDSVRGFWLRVGFTMTPERKAFVDRRNWRDDGILSIEGITIGEPPYEEYEYDLSKVNSLCRR